MGEWALLCFYILETPDHFLAATQDLAKKTLRLTKGKGESMRTGSWPGEEGEKGIHNLDFLPEVTGQEVRVEAER